MCQKYFYLSSVCILIFITISHVSVAQNPQDIDKYLAEYEKFKSSNNISELSAIANKLGYAYWGGSDYQNAVKYFEEGMKYSEEIGNKNGIAVANSSIGGILSEQGKHSNALPYLKKALEMKEALRDRKGVAQAYLNIGVTNFDLKKHQDAISNLNLAVEKGKEVNASYVVTDAYDYLSKCYEIIGDSKKALEYQRLFMESTQVEGQVFIDDLEQQKKSISAQNAEQRLALEETSEEVETLRIQKQLVEQRAKAQKSEIARLKTEQQLKEAQIKNNEAELEAKRVSERYNMILIAFLGSVVIMLLVIVFILRKANAEKRKAALEIKVRQQMIEEKNEKIKMLEDEVEKLKQNLNRKAS